MKRSSDRVLFFLALSVLALALPIYFAYRKLDRLEERVAGLEIRVEQMEPRPDAQSRAPRRNPPVPVEAAVAGGPAVDSGIRPGTLTEVLGALQNLPVRELQAEADDELTELTASLGLNGDDARFVRESIHGEIADWYAMLAAWWSEPRDGAALPFDDPEYLAGLQTILHRTDEGILGRLRDDQAGIYREWRVRFESRYVGVVEEGPR